MERPRMALPICLASHAILTCAISANAQDWSSYSVPASAGTGQHWVLDPNLSDEFNYDSATPAGQSEFFANWQDWKPNFFLGPGATYFSQENWFVDSGAMTIFGSRVPLEDQIVNTSDPNFTRTTYTSFITSKAKLQPGSYTEAMIKGGGTALSTNFWLIDDGDVTEIDVLEIYGDTDWFRKRPRTNAIFQIRDQNGNLIQKIGSQMTHPNNDINYSQTWHRYGVYWASTTDLEFYIDGNLVRTINLPSEVVDPTGNYMNRDLRLIFDMEAHAWRGAAGIPSDAELNDWSINNMQIDWVRTYRAAELSGDFDSDGRVDGLDFLKWQTDGLSASDLADWEANYGMVAPSTANVTTVPEPSTLVLITLSLGLIRRQSNRNRNV